MTKLSTAASIIPSDVFAVFAADSNLALKLDPQSPAKRSSGKLQDSAKLHGQAHMGDGSM